MKGMQTLWPARGPFSSLLRPFAPAFLRPHRPAGFQPTSSPLPHPLPPSITCSSVRLFLLPLYIRSVPLSSQNYLIPAALGVFSRSVSLLIADRALIEGMRPGNAVGDKSGHAILLTRWVLSDLALTRTQK